MAPNELPTGTVTFLFTDIEGSTQILQELGDRRYAEVLAGHDQLLRAAVEDAGIVVKVTGDSFFAVFTDPVDAVVTAAEAQRRLSETKWLDGVDLRVRMGLHTGAGVIGGEDYVGIDVHRTSRISDAAHGEQVLLSSVIADSVVGRLPDGLAIRSLGIHRLRGLTAEETVHQLVIAGLTSEFPPLRAKGASINHLPLQVTSFVGRSAEIREVEDLLKTTQLVTLTGPGGTGKTRLSIEVARRVADDYADGAHFVPLEAITEPDLVPPAILDSLGLSRAAGSAMPFDHLRGYLAERQMILVLDNFEQILSASGLVSELMAHAPDVRFIVSSRAPLHLRGEREYPVPPLKTPEVGTRSNIEALQGFEGVELFRERALAVAPTFDLNVDNLPAVAALIQRLDGLPLAIELAASRMRLLSPQAMLERLDNRLLTNPGADVPARQQTIINTIGWSYDLLDPPTQRLFERCSVFMGGAGLEHIEVVSGGGDELGVDVLDGLATLVDNSLIKSVTVDAEPRYNMLVVVREYAYAALVARGDVEVSRRRHAELFASLAREATPWLLSSHQTLWLDRLARDHDNLRTALEWAIERQETDLALGIVSDLWRFWQIRGHLLEASDRIDAALGLPGGSPRARAKALEAKGGVLYWRGEWLAAYEPYTESLAIMREHGSEADLANALYNATFPTGFSGDDEQARRLLEESRALAEKADDHLGIGRALWGMGDMDIYQGDYASGIEHTMAAAAEFEQVDAPFDLAWARFVTGHGHTLLGHAGEARMMVDDAVKWFAAARDLSGIVLVLDIKAMILLMEGDEETAAMLAGAAQTLKTETGARISDVNINQYRDVQKLVSDGGPRISAAHDRGRAMGPDEAIALAVSS